MRILIKKFLPIAVYQRVKFLYNFFLKTKLLIFGRALIEAESAKARPRRNREMFFETYFRGNGLDVGYGGDLIHPSAVGWDFEHGDAQILSSVNDRSMDYVYSSHTLEHMLLPNVALRNWWRVIKPGGYLILYIPERDLYEKKTQLPSKWNLDHKHFFLLETDELPSTIGILPLINRELSDFNIIYSKICSEGYFSGGPDVHSIGEYSIEVVLQKSYS
jgi:SAM-dependent methyltransferase